MSLYFQNKKIIIVVIVVVVVVSSSSSSSSSSNNNKMTFENELKAIFVELLLRVFLSLTFQV